MAKKIKRLMAYIYMPLIFIIVGYGILWVAAAPVFELLYNVGSMILVQDVPDFNVNLSNIFVDKGMTVEEQPQSVAVEDVQIPSFGQQYAQISCERIGLSAPVYFGDSNDILRVGAGQYIGSFYPGYGRVIMLCAHNTTFFKPLQNVEVGDIFVYKTNYGVFEYQVTDTAVKDHNDTSAYDFSLEKEQLILYTCYPFERMVGTKTDRLFVYCDKVSGPVVVD